MSFKNSKDNLTANIAQQFSAMLIAIVVPMLMSVDEYAQVVVVGVLISFMQLADLGMSIVYTRKLPALYANNSRHDILIWNATLSRFRFYASLAYGGVIAVYFFQRYPHGFNTGMLFIFVVLSIVTLFVTLNATVQSDFRYIRNISIAQSLGRLAILPGTWIAGIKGWFIGQLLSIVVVFYSKRLRRVLHESLFDHHRMDWTLIKRNLSQGIILSMITTLWLQLLSSGRMYAAFFYPDAIVAQYGLVGSIYQIVVSMGIAVFVPQTITIYRLVEQDKAAAINYAFKLIVYSAPVFILSGLALTYIAPVVVEILFPKYNIDSGLYAPLMLSLFNCAVMVTLGSLLIGMDRAKHYLALIAIAAVADFCFIIILAPAAKYIAAAEAQLLALSTYALTLVVMVNLICRNINYNRLMMWLACIPSMAAPIIYFILFRG